jgi:AcrR family transcriptional regulator
MSTSARHRTASYHHGDLRRALIDAAAMLVAQSGPAAVSLREAARAVGVSHAAPYRHFASREALLAAVATLGFEELGRRLELAREQSPPGERLQALGAAYVRFALERRGAYLLMFGDAVEKADHPELQSAARRAFGILEEVVQAETGPKTARPAAAAAWALVHGLAHLAADRQFAPDLAGTPQRLDGLIETATGIFLTGLRHGLPPGH